MCSCFIYAKVVITGIGAYIGKVTKTYKIVAKNISKCNFSKLKEYKYTSKLIKPVITGKDGKIKLKKNKDYIVSYKNNKKKGKAIIIIKGKGNYKSEKKLYFVIK